MSPKLKQDLIAVRSEDAVSVNSTQGSYTFALGSTYYPLQMALVSVAVPL